MLRPLLVLRLAVTVCSSLTCDDSVLGLAEVVWHSEPSHIYLGSPSILRLPNGQLLASADRFGSGFKTPRNVSLYTSVDNGTNWSFHTWIEKMYWANLFESGGHFYLLGTDHDGPSNIKISRSVDGLSWPTSQQVVLVNGSYNTGPTPAALSNGRLFRAMESFRPPHHWGVDYGAVVMSASAGDDLLDPSSWTLTEPLYLDVKWLPPSWGKLPTPGYLEGNAVEAPDGTMKNILRLNTAGSAADGNHAVKLELSGDHKKLSFERVLNFPGGHSKFVIRRDPVTQLYFTLSNLNTDVKYADQRNVLVLCASSDLDNWAVLETLLQDDTGLQPQDSVRYTGFHYVDWQFDAAGIIYLIRTAYRGANSYHNSDRLTYKVRSPDFRDLALSTGLVWLQVSPVAGAGLEPRFQPSVTNYTAGIDFNASSVTVSPIMLLPSATVTVDGKPVSASSGSAHEVPFAAGVDKSTITVRITLPAREGQAASVVVVYTIECTRMQPTAMTVAGSGFVLGIFENGAKAWMNRGYQFGGVPAALDGRQFTRISGGAGTKGAPAAVMTAMVRTVGSTVYAAVGPRNIRYFPDGGAGSTESVVCYNCIRILMRNP
jgi:hypothetical protein